MNRLRDIGSAVATQPQQDWADAYLRLTQTFEAFCVFDPDDPRSLLMATASVAEACEALATIIVASRSGATPGVSPAARRWSARVIRHSIEWWKRSATAARRLSEHEPLQPPPSAIAFLLLVQAEDLLCGGYVMPSGAATRAAMEICLEEACKRLGVEVLTHKGKVPNPPQTQHFINSLHRSGHITLETRTGITKSVRVGNACAHGCIPSRERVRELIAFVREHVPFANEEWVVHPLWTLDHMDGVEDRWVLMADVEQECIDETEKRRAAFAAAAVTA